VNAIGHLRNAARRHTHLADATIALAVFAATAVTTFTGQPMAADGDRVTALAAAVVACGVLTGRRHRPLAALVISAAAAEMFLVVAGGGSNSDSGSSAVLILLAPSIALYTVAELVERQRGLIFAGSAVAALALMHALLHPGTIGPENLAFTALGALAIAAGDSSRNRRAYLGEVERRAERSELERELDGRRRVAAERLRIARDLHDSVGHHLALISVQSDVAGRALDGDSGTAREALTHVKSASRKALDELRDTVSLLRQPGDPAAPTAIPAPGLDALEELLAALRGSGLTIDCLVKGTAVPLAPAADLTAYRVIQESLTNVFKHSRRRQARLTLGYDRHELRITVDDLGCSGLAEEREPGQSGLALDLVPAPGSGSGGRHGIRGMRERVLALGGQFTAGPRAGGAFRVAAVLPYQPLDLTHWPLP